MVFDRSPLRSAGGGNPRSGALLLTELDLARLHVLGEARDFVAEAGVLLRDALLRVESFDHVVEAFGADEDPDRADAVVGGLERDETGRGHRARTREVMAHEAQQARVRTERGRRLLQVERGAVVRLGGAIDVGIDLTYFAEDTRRLSVFVGDRRRFCSCR